MRPFKMNVRQLLLRGLFVVVLVSAAVLSGYALPYPERWNEELVGLSRKDAWSLLGVPDIAYTEKGFDGWNRDAIFGAWVLIVRYGENEKITRIERKYSWGLGYLSWDSDYRKQWKKPN